MPMNPRLLRPILSGDPDALRYIAAVQQADGQSLEAGVKKAINDFVTGCKSDGIWDFIKASCILAGARTLAGALVPLKGAAPTNNNFTASDYNRETGLVGDGSTTYLDSNRNNNADPQDSSHIAVYASSLDANAAIGIYLGAGGGGETGRTMMLEQSASVLRVRSRSSALTSSSQNEAIGFMAVARPDDSNISVRSDGGTSSHAVASESPVSANYFVFGTNSSGIVANATNARLAFYSIGESLDLAALDTRVSALITAIGNAI